MSQLGLYIHLPIDHMYIDEIEKDVEWGGLKLRPYEIPQMEGQFDLDLEMMEGSLSVFGTFKYNTDLFDGSTIERMTEHFQNLLEYSPLHNLKQSVAYPATLVTTADHGDRVVPAHSFKFAAQLQKSHTGDNPVIIRVAVDAGHGAGKRTSKILDEEADKWAFFFENTNSPWKPAED